MASSDPSLEKDNNEKDNKRKVFIDATIQAELDTGLREPNIATAKRHLLVRLVRLAIAIPMLLVGLALLILPGPGLLLILAALGLLSVDFAFAANLRAQLVRRADSATAWIPRPVRNALVVLALIASIGFTLVMI